MVSVESMLLLSSKSMSLFTKSCDEGDDDDKKGQSCFVGSGNVLLKLSNTEELMSLGSCMM